MPQQGLIFRVLVASPGDCVEERRIIPEVIAGWNAVHSVATAAVVEPVLWETHVRPAMGDRPQGIINKQLVEQCDLLIGAFWTRLGTPTGVAESGTAEEIEQFRAAGKPVLLYFSSAPVVPESLDQDQYRALIAYRDRLGRDGLYSRYDSAAEFREQLQRHIAGTMIDLLKAEDPQRAVAPPVNPDPMAEQRAGLREFQQQFGGFLRRFTAEWTAERDSNSHSIEEGKYILAHAADEIAHFRSMITHDSSGVSTILDDAGKRLRSLRKHGLFLDGGASRREFWAEGDAVLESLGSAYDLITQALAEGDGSTPST